MPPAGPLLPLWLLVPPGLLVMLLISMHIAWMRADRDSLPPSRYRIRTFNAGVMLGAVPLIIYAFGVAHPGDPRAFLLAWTAVVGLLAIILMLAFMDAANNLRLNARAAGQLRRDAERLRAELALFRARHARAASPVESPAAAGHTPGETHAAAPPAPRHDAGDRV